MKVHKRRRRRRWWSPAWRWRHRSSLRRDRTWQGRKKRRSCVRIVVGAFVAVLAVLVVGAALVVYELSSVRADLVSARMTLSRVIDNPAVLRTGQGRAAVITQVDLATGSLTRARSRASTSFSLKALRYLPGLSAQRSGLIQLIDDSKEAARTGRQLLDRVGTLADSARVTGGQVPIDQLVSLSRDIAEARDSIGRLARPRVRLWSSLGEARRRFDEVALDTSQRLTGVADALMTSRTFLGADGPRRYLIALQNNAEMRDQGMVLSYAVVRFAGGRMTFERSGPIRELTLDRPTSTALPAGTLQIFATLEPTRLWQSVNASADFPLSARTMSDMYQQATGQPVEGVIAIDVPGLAALLRVIGPVTVPGVVPPISASNAADVLLHDLYEGLPPVSEQSERRGQLNEVTAAVIDRLTTGSHDPLSLGAELGEAARGGHLRLWSASQPEQVVFERTGLGGGPASFRADRTFHVAVQNRTATKLDYYLKPSVRHDVRLTPEGTAIVDTIVTVDNQAPRGPPSYQLGPDAGTAEPGDYIAWVLLWGAQGSKQQPEPVSESGLELSQQITYVKAGEKAEVSFQTVIPRAVRDDRLELRLVPQSRLVPMPLEVNLKTSGWDVEGEMSWKGHSDRVRTFVWEVRQ